MTRGGTADLRTREMRGTSTSFACATSGAPFAIPAENLPPGKDTKIGMLDEPSKQRMKELCDLIVKEQDHQRFSSLVAELNRLLDDCYTAPPINSKKERL